jgi:Sir2 family
MVISGAGVSVSCGIPDFRSKDGLYDRIEARFALPDPQCLFSLDYLKDDPEPFFEFAKVRSLIHFLSNSRTLELSNSRTLFPSFFLCFSPSFFPLSVCLCFPVFHILLAYVLSLSIYVSTTLSLSLSLSLFVSLYVSICLVLLSLSYFAVDVLKYTYTYTPSGALSLSRDVSFADALVHQTSGKPRKAVAQLYAEHRRTGECVWSLACLLLPWIVVHTALYAVQSEGER